MCSRAGGNTQSDTRRRRRPGLPPAREHEVRTDWTRAEIGALFDLPHAETHAVLLPHTIAYNTPAAPDAIGHAARALGAADAADGLFDLSAKLGAPRSLAEIGMPEDGIAKAAALATRNPYWNPRPIEERGIADLLKRAWSGARPHAG